MGKFGCTCGRIIGLGAVPLACLISGRPSRKVIECPECGRLWIEDGNLYLAYLPEGREGAVDLFREKR